MASGRADRAPEPWFWGAVARILLGQILFFIDLTY